MSTALSPLEKKRNAVLQRMPEPSQALVLELEKSIAREAAGKILTAYSIGAKIVEAHNDEATYGSNFMNDAAEYLNFPGGSRMLYELMNLAKAFSREYIKTQSQRLTSTGSPLEVSHWLQLTRIEDATQQQKMLDKALAASWSARELAAEINTAGVNRRQPRGPGRRPNQPTSPLSGLHQLYKTSIAFTNMRETMEQAVFDQIDHLSNATVTEALLDKLLATLDKCTEARDAADTAVARLEKGRDYVQELLKAAPPAEASDGTTAPEPEARGAARNGRGAAQNGRTTAKKKGGKKGKKGAKVTA